MIDVLIPTDSRKTGLAITLTSLVGQTFHDFSVTVADQRHFLLSAPREPYVLVVCDYQLGCVWWS